LPIKYLLDGSPPWWLFHHYTSATMSTGGNDPRTPTTPLTPSARGDVSELDLGSLRENSYLSASHGIPDDAGWRHWLTNLSQRQALQVFALIMPLLSAMLPEGTLPVSRDAADATSQGTKATTATENRAWLAAANKNK